MILTDYFIKRAVHRGALSSNRNRRFKTMEEVRNVLLMYNVKDSKEIEVCAAQLKKMGKRIYACGYKADEMPLLENDHTHIYVQPEKDITLWGMPKSAVLQKMNEWKPDMVIDLTRNKEYVMQYLFLKCDCDFKTGIKSGEKELYDFSVSIAENKDLIYLFGQIIFYLQTIRSK